MQRLADLKLETITIDVGLAQNPVEDSEARAFGTAWPAAWSPPLSNFAICPAIPHMQNMSPLDASCAEPLFAGVVSTQPASRERLEAFADKTGPRVKPQ